MLTAWRFVLTFSLAMFVMGCTHGPLAHAHHPNFEDQFSMPREPRTLLTPGQFFEMSVPEGKKIIITDVYVENLGGGKSQFVILEQRLPSSFEVRYAFGVRDEETLNINYTTGLKLGDEAPIAGTVRIQNDSGSSANILPRVNGILIDG